MDVQVQEGRITESKGKKVNEEAWVGSGAASAATFFALPLSRDSAQPKPKCGKERRDDGR